MMQQMSLSLVSSRNEFISSQKMSHTTQMRPITCPHCGVLSLTTGKVKNSWYLLCRCGTYVQISTENDDYSD